MGMGSGLLVDDQPMVVDLLRQHLQILEEIEEPATFGHGVSGEGTGEELHDVADFIDAVDVEVDQAQGQVAEDWLGGDGDEGDRADEAAMGFGQAVLIELVEVVLEFVFDDHGGEEAHLVVGVIF